MQFDGLVGLLLSHLKGLSIIENSKFSNSVSGFACNSIFKYSDISLVVSMIRVIYTSGRLLISNSDSNAMT